MVKAGDKTLESYLYAPNNGPLITVAYGNGDTQEILYDKEERIRARRWNGAVSYTHLDVYKRQTYAYTEGAVSTVQTQDLFTYRTDGWKDQLLSWNGKSYAYDAGGNPTVLRGMALTWGEGRRLKRIAATCLRQ